MYIKILNVIMFEADVHSVTVLEKTNFVFPVLVYCKFILG